MNTNINELKEEFLNNYISIHQDDLDNYNVIDLFNDNNVDILIVMKNLIIEAEDHLAYIVQDNDYNDFIADYANDLTNMIAIRELIIDEVNYF